MWCCWISQDDSGFASLLGPEQAEGFGRQQRVDRAIEDMLQRHAPGLSFPDRIHKLAVTVGEKCGDGEEVEYFMMFGAGAVRYSREAADDHAGQDAESEP